MTRELTLFLVCAYEIVLILFVATAAKSAAKSFPEIASMTLVCQATSTVTLRSDGPVVVHGNPFEVFVGTKYIHYDRDILQREYVRNATKVFG